MYKMRWSWEQLEATPVYVRRYVGDHLTLIGEREARDAREPRG